MYQHNKKGEGVGHQWESMIEPIGFFDANRQLLLRVSLFQNRKLPQERINGSCIFSRLCLSLDNVSSCSCSDVFILK